MACGRDDDQNTKESREPLHCVIRSFTELPEGRWAAHAKSPDPKLSAGPAREPRASQTIIPPHSQRALNAAAMRHVARPGSPARLAAAVFAAAATGCFLTLPARHVPRILNED